MAFAGLLPRSRLFPKAICVELLESEWHKQRGSNLHVVLYKHVAHAPGHETAVQKPVLDVRGF